ncbi:hypothetical protein HanPSC8_Chr17g0747731 [Helianthus annuus]|nr:hypothetical protein HanPSC8_Chr17g0747731 [Helianthus annuus]
MYMDHWSPGPRLGRLPVSPAFADAMFYRAPAAALTDLRPETILPPHERLAGVTAG